MSEKRGTLEDAEGAVLQDPRDMAKAALPESQSPAVQLSHSLLQRLERSATRGHPFGFAGGHLRLARRWGTTSLKGMNGTPKSHSIRSTPTERGMA